MPTPGRMSTAHRILTPIKDNSAPSSPSVDTGYLGSHWCWWQFPVPHPHHVLTVPFYAPKRPPYKLPNTCCASVNQVGEIFDDAVGSVFLTEGSEVLMISFFLRTRKLQTTQRCGAVILSPGANGPQRGESRREGVGMKQRHDQAAIRDASTIASDNDGHVKRQKEAGNEASSDGELQSFTEARHHTEPS
ncbi:hypothetical protein JOB18_037530 [Solea senegalensis]|uniref:Uncharacterized protein n=1 Tax=Solea senegalensis TaxID=28829 RepID=A0AAV6PU14_SOLSE|nr:hypothetical protein JOB18_037530 [Solea senegalensis]